MSLSERADAYIAIRFVAEGRIIVLRDKFLGRLGQADGLLGFGVLGEDGEAEGAKEDAAKGVATADAGGVAAVRIIGHR
jgi:hypothetical protein